MIYFKVRENKCLEDTLVVGKQTMLNENRLL